MDSTKDSPLIKLLYLFIPLMNVTLLKSGGFRGIMLLEILILFIIFKDIKKLLNPKIFSLIILLLISPWLLYPLIIDSKEFLLTYVTIIFYIILLIIISKKKPSINYIRAFIIGVSIVAIYGIIQFIITNIGIDSLINFIRKPFGNRLTFSVLPISYFGKFMRVNSLFYEPSIFGTYCLFGYALCLTYQTFNKFVIKALFIIGIIISFSTTAYIGIVAILLFRMILSKKNIFLKYISSISIISCSIILFYLLIGKRISEIVYVGSSTYYRFIAPLKLIQQIMFKEGKILGLPLGQIESYIIKGNYDFMVNGLEMGTSIDNAIAVFILYTGILSIILLVIIILKLKKYLIRSNSYLFISFIILLLTTGGINFIYFNVLMCIFIQAIKLKYYEERIKPKLDI